MLLLLLLLPAAAAAIPHIAASNTAVASSAAANSDVPAAASIAAAAVPASEFQENPLEGRRNTDHKAVRSSSKVSIICHLAKHLASFLGHWVQVLNMEF